MALRLWRGREERMKAQESSKVTTDEESLTLDTVYESLADKPEIVVYLQDYIGGIQGERDTIEADFNELLGDYTGLYEENERFKMQVDGMTTPPTLIDTQMNVDSAVKERSETNYMEKGLDYVDRLVMEGERKNAD